MAEQPAGEKTEAPTPKRKREAREKGQIAKTPELSAWIGLLAATLLIQFTIANGSRQLKAMFNDMAPVIAHPEPALAMKFAGNAVGKAFLIAAPMTIGMMVIGLVVNIAQVGFKPTGKKMKPDFSRLNPFKGIKKMVGANAWWELGKAVAKTILLAVVGVPILTGAMHTLISGEQGTSAFVIAKVTADTAMTLFRNVAIVGLLVAVADYSYQRRRINKQLRMTRQELREEMKQQEGNPEMKGAVRRRAMAISRNRMISAVSMADVISVNPTHYAVALKYDAEKGAPEVLAKGAGVIAAAIRAAGEKHGVPIVHEPVLTRALYATCDIGQVIPVEMYEAVALLLAFVFGLRAKGRAQGYHELPRPALL
jgi:flagellar biosynthetic protein FlhB